MFNKQEQVLRKVFAALTLVSSCFYLNASAAMAKDPLEAAQDLAGANQTDPNGFALMIISIGMLFAFAITLIVATSVHVFKKKPRRQTAAPSRHAAEPSFTGSAAQR